MAHLLLVERYHLLPDILQTLIYVGQVERCGLVTNEHELEMDVGAQHELTSLAGT